MTRILFVDDEEVRFTLLKMRDFFPEEAEVCSVNNAIDAITAVRDELWDTIFLDHDLNTFVDGQEITGLDVAKSIIQFAVGAPDCIIHSMNQSAAWRMEKTLQEEGFFTQVIPFHKLPERM